MGHTTKSIPFFTDDITIRPHTASLGKWIDRPVSIKEFSNGGPCSLEQIEDGKDAGEYIVRLPGGGLGYGDFIQGPEV